MEAIDTTYMFRVRDVREEKLCRALRCIALSHAGALLREGTYSITLKE
jgi:hypothetical protein